MTPAQMTDRLNIMEKYIIHKKNGDAQTKYECVSMFHYLKKLIKYQIPTPPVNVSEDKHKFECPTCGTKFDSEDTVDDFNLCYICGQRWKEEQWENR